jgi:hypothetical protein
MSALSKVEMSVSAPFWEFGGCHFDGHGGDEHRIIDAQISYSLTDMYGSILIAGAMGYPSARRDWSPSRSPESGSVCAPG